MHYFTRLAVALLLILTTVVGYSQDRTITINLDSAKIFESEKLAYHRTINYEITGTAKHKTVNLKLEKLSAGYYFRQRKVKILEAKIDSFELRQNDNLIKNKKEFRIKRLGKKIRRLDKSNIPEGIPVFDKPLHTDGKKKLFGYIPQHLEPDETYRLSVEFNEFRPLNSTQKASIKGAIQNRIPNNFIFLETIKENLLTVDFFNQNNNDLLFQQIEQANNSFYDSYKSLIAGMGGGSNYSINVKTPIDTSFYKDILYDLKQGYKILSDKAQKSPFYGNEFPSMSHVIDNYIITSNGLSHYLYIPWKSNPAKSELWEIPKAKSVILKDFKESYHNLSADSLDKMFYSLVDSTLEKTVVVLSTEQNTWIEGDDIEDFKGISVLVNEGGVFSTKAGMNIHTSINFLFQQRDKSLPLKYYSYNFGSYLKNRTFLSVGFTNTDVEKGLFNPTDNAFGDTKFGGVLGDKSLLLGGGFQPIKFLTIDLGASLVSERLNPIATDKKLSAGFYAGFSFSLNIGTLFKLK